MKKLKIKQAHWQGIAGISGILLGLYMLLILKNIRGLLPFVIGIGILLWKFK